ncbi:hypothetical protein [Mycolicibacterium litorale]|uniref:GP55 protein n=1 Tax=Mycolicibacterium litorale TaxID=758802 RepID=A0AAD1IQH1_9MYCO|nr:hypothetical protein [Mycolicibacterium litorale]MCV7413686.1 hypothetical protein [Mycolicibacterium litorale]TDY11588.1 hypothetical protein BCL50_0005 [Mycolicibacterium litorale]BBY15888.1 hypothetical protein MLIT_14800 [Mycolicibacterium litorale]
MSLASLIAVTLACLAWSLWVRRVTWSCRWEVAATLNIALQACAVALMSPAASEALGPVMYRLTGVWNLEDYIGHDCYIVAATAVVYNALGRLGDDHVLQEKFRYYIQCPATLCIPLLLAAFTLGNGAAVYRPDFFDVPTDFWLDVYWLLLCGMLVYLLVYASRALLVLRRDPRSRRIANVYLVASAAGVIACAVRVTTALFDPLQAVNGSIVVWTFACICGGAFAFGSAHSWRRRVNWLRGADVH